MKSSKRAAQQIFTFLKLKIEPLETAVKSAQNQQ